MQKRREDSKQNSKQASQRALIEDLLRTYSKCTYVRLVHRGNASIFCALTMVKEIVRTRRTLLIPDQGGWISFETYPPLLGFDVVKVRTNRGIVDLEDLAQKSVNAAAFLVTSFAGYFAEQPIKAIADVCHKNGCLVIEDASGSIGDAMLCNGTVADVVVASFGDHKPVNNGYGGFFAANNKEFFDANKVAVSMTNFYQDYACLLEKLKEVPARLEFFFGKQARVKQDMKKLGIEVLHPILRGLNVVVKPKSATEKKKVLAYCKEHELETVVCPKYIRVDEDAISIEIKRLA